MESKDIERIFTQNEIYCPSPSEFNDPFDCRIPFVMEGTQADFKKFYNSILKDQYPEKFRSERRRITTGMLKDKKHKDPETHRRVCKQALEYLVSKLGVFCLSAKNDDILMWSHYSSGHKGFCLGFERGEEISPFKDAKPVTYKEAYPRINYFRTEDSEKFKRLLFTKSLNWIYEKEWRIIFDEKGVSNFPEESLVKLIFGCQMADEDKNKIRSWLQGRKNPVRLYQAKMKDQKFGLEMVPM